MRMIILVRKPWDGHRVEIPLSAMTTIIMAGKKSNECLTNYYITEPEQPRLTTTPAQPEEPAHHHTHFLWQDSSTSIPTSLAGMAEWRIA